MKYILDTNQIIDFFRNIHPTVEKLTPLFIDGVAISVIALAEYLRGAYQSNNPEKSVKAFHDFLQVGQIRILDIDIRVATQYAKLQADFEKKGQRMPHFDLLIASTALVYNLALVSNDKAFTKIKNLKLI